MRALLLALALLASPAAARPLAIVHAHAWTMTGDTPVDDATIDVDAGRIVSVAAHGTPPAGAEIVDAHEATVTPGLMSGATQLGLVEVSGAGETSDRSVSGGPLGAAFDVEYAVNAQSLPIPLARADGLTRAMDFPDPAGSGPFAGQGAVVRLVDAPDVVDRARAAMFVAVGSETAARSGGSRSAQWGLIRNALDEAKDYAARREHGGPRDQLLDRPDVEALGPVVAGRMPLVVAADRESDIRQAIRLAADYRLRVIILGGAEAWRAAPELAAAGIAVVLDPMSNMPTTFDALGSRLDNAALLAEAGVPIAFTVSGNGIYLTYDAGIALREGAGIAVANGLPYPAALRAVTSAPARIWGIADHYGTLAPGQDADLVIWDGDPLEPASAPTAVFVRGERASLVTRQTLLRDRYRPGQTAR